MTAASDEVLSVFDHLYGMLCHSRNVASVIDGKAYMVQRQKQGLNPQT